MGRTINDLGGGARAKAGKKTQLLLALEKIKLNSKTWKKKLN